MRDLYASMPYTGCAAAPTAARFGDLRSHRRTDASLAFFYVCMHLHVSYGRAIAGIPSGMPVSVVAGSPTLLSACPPHLAMGSGFIPHTEAAMANHPPRTSAHVPEPIDPSYQFQVGDLVEYTLPDTGEACTGVILFPYALRKYKNENDKEVEGYCYVGELDDCEELIAMPVAGIRLRPDLEAARTDNVFQAFLTSVITAPRRGRLPKSPYGAAPKNKTKGAQ